MKLFLLFAFSAITFCSYSQNEYKFTKEDNKWIKYLTEHINKGEIQYLGILGHFYMNIKLYNDHPFYNKGMEYIKQGALLGDTSCIYEYGMSYYNTDGRGTYDEKSNPYMDSASKCLTLAAKAGMADAMYTLGYLYLNGCNINQYMYNKNVKRQDLVLARAWFDMAAQHGKKGAAEQSENIVIASNHPFEKALAASKGGDYALAMKLYTIAADINDDEIAAYNIGILYYNGQGVERSKDYALSAFEKSGRLGFAKGSNDAAEIYWEGGYGKSAIEWFTKAISQGYTAANEALANVKAQLAYNASKRAEFFAEYNRKQNELANNESSSGMTQVQIPPAKTYCNDCHGTGKVARIEYYTDKISGLQSGRTVYDNCLRCYGKGYY